MLRTDRQTDTVHHTNISATFLFGKRGDKNDTGSDIADRAMLNCSSLSLDETKSR